MFCYTRGQYNHRGTNQDNSLLDPAFRLYFLLTIILTYLCLTEFSVLWLIFDIDNLQCAHWEKVLQSEQCLVWNRLVNHMREVHHYQNGQNKAMNENYNIIQINLLGSPQSHAILCSELEIGSTKSSLLLLLVGDITENFKLSNTVVAEADHKVWFSSTCIETSLLILDFSFFPFFFLFLFFLLSLFFAATTG